MKKKKKVEFYTLKKGQCFRIRKQGAIYQRDDSNCAQIIKGKRAGKTIWIWDESKKVYPVKVKIVEVK